MLGAVAKTLGFSLDSLAKAIREKFTGDKNYLGALEAYEKVRNSG
jgi:Pyruvate/2-oxoacid:ferredoxin oxidoreductase gamma subunit